MDDEEELRAALAEFGIYLPDVEENVPDDLSLPGWDESDVEEWQ